MKANPNGARNCFLFVEYNKNAALKGEMIFNGSAAAKVCF